ncbi:MAG: glycosyltransferase [Candidatus Moraniibacteriota bacterium]|nr:MAG: glycosyltransferase [Candidatus Moranbacteria bacterium]
MSKMAKPLEIMGCPCLSFADENSVKAYLKGVVQSGSGGYTVAINAEKLMRRRSDSELDAVIRNAALPVADGAGAVLALKWLHGRSSLKVDMPKCTFEAADENGWRVFVLGSAEPVNAAATEKIAHIYPGINIVGRLNGYADYDGVLSALKAAKPQIVFLALGSPKQELLAGKLSKVLKGIVFVGCGGALDILAGKVSRAPKFFIENNLEWAYRLYKQPSRWRRQLVLPVFFSHLVSETFAMRLRRLIRTSS